MEALKGYRTEVGDVLFSIQLTLIREEQRAGSRPERIVAPLAPRSAPPVADGETPHVLTPALLQTGTAASAEPASWLPASWNRAQPGAAANEQDGVEARPGSPPSATAELKLIDPDTGAGTTRALRRDLVAAGASSPSSGESPAVVVIRVEPLADLRRRDADEQADALLVAVVEMVPFMVRARDRLYRVGPNELALLMPATDAEGVEAALERLVERLPKTLAQRKLGYVRLVARRVPIESLLPDATARLAAG